MRYDVGQFYKERVMNEIWGKWKRRERERKKKECRENFVQYVQYISALYHGAKILTPWIQTCSILQAFVLCQNKYLYAKLNTQVIRGCYKVLIKIGGYYRYSFWYDNLYNRMLYKTYARRKKENRYITFCFSFDKQKAKIYSVIFRLNCFKKSRTFIQYYAN